MIFVFGKRQIPLAGLVCCFFMAFAAVLWTGHGLAVPVFSAGESTPLTWVIDPGHGGEDGGAVASDGIVAESQLNLEIALRVQDLMAFLGQESVMTRSEDISIHSSSAKSAREKKVSDLHNRVALVNETKNAVLLSIHQNSLPSSPVTHGAQVFWNSREGAGDLAQSVQDALNLTINPGNEKHTKKIPGTIYLMKNVTAPAVLVECGFLSNPEETQQLRQPAHQLRLAASITAGCLAW